MEPSLSCLLSRAWRINLALGDVDRPEVVIDNPDCVGRASEEFRRGVENVSKLDEMHSLFLMAWMRYLKHTTSTTSQLSSLLYNHIAAQALGQLLHIPKSQTEDDPRFMPPTSAVWSVMHHVFMAAVILLMDVCFNWDDLLADQRKPEVLDACRTLSKAQGTSSLVSQGIQAMMDVLQKHWKSGKHSSADGQASNLPSSPALGATAVAEPAEIVPYQDSNTIDIKDSPADPSFLIDQNESQERPLEDIWTEMLDSGGDLNFTTPDWTDLLTELTNATLPCS